MLSHTSPEQPGLSGACGGLSSLLTGGVPATGPVNTARPRAASQASSPKSSPCTSWGALTLPGPQEPLSSPQQGPFWDPTWASARKGEASELRLGRLAPGEVALVTSRGSSQSYCGQPRCPATKWQRPLSQDHTAVPSPVRLLPALGDPWGPALIPQDQDSCCL